MISLSMHGTVDFYIADVESHKGGGGFVTREIFFTSDRGDKIRVTLFADKDAQHRLDPKVPTKEFIQKNAV